ncbi:MAG: ABC transporter permease [Anaerolineae bacterium]|nr:ABC transporter permease [Anaerolineae bacterium]
MRRRTWAVIEKELMQMLRDPSTLVILLLIPVLQLVLFGFAINTNIDHIPTVVADQSLDAASHAYVEALANSTYFDIVGYVSDEAAVIRAIDAGTAQAGVVIPPGFAAQVERGSAQALFLIDGSEVFTTQAGYSLASLIAQMHASDVLLEKVARFGLPVNLGLPISTRTRVLYNPDQDQMRFSIPNMVALLLQTQSISLTAAAVVRERESGTIEQLLVTPIRPFELLLGKTIPNLVIAMINMLTVVALGVYLFGVPFQGSFWLFMGLSLIYVFSGLGLGLLISTLSQNMKQAQQMIMMVLMVGVILGGFMFPRYSMPPVLRALGNLFPLSYFIHISRGIIAKGVGAGPLWPNIGALLGYSVAILFVAVKSFRQRLD